MDSNPSDRTPAGRKPLTGIRIADFSWYGVGPYCTLMLAMMGAEVIRVESNTRPDISRRPHFAYGRTYVALYDHLLAGKRSITLNLKEPQARDLAVQLVAASDIVVENFRPGVMDKLGLGFQALSRVKADLLMLSASANGQTGPECRVGGFAPIFGAMGGLGHITGYVDGPPVEMRNAMDHVSGLMGCYALLAALRHRQQTGRGQHIDLSSREVAITLVGDALLDWAYNGHNQSRRGNQDIVMAPHSVYPARGEDSWVAIAVGTEQEWQGLCEAMGHREWATDERFAYAYRRKHHEVELDALIAAWTRGLDGHAAVALLQAHGVAATVSMSGRDLVHDHHLRERGMVHEIRDEHKGSRLITDAPWRFSDTSAGLDRWSPEVGQDNEYVYCGLLGLTREELAAMIEARVIC